MSGGSKAAPVPTATSQTITTNNIPSYLAPYIQDVAGKSQAIANEKYVTYPGQRIAGFDPLQTQAQNQMARLGAINFGQAKNYVGQVGQYGLQAGQAGINRANEYLAAPTQQFGAAQAAQYMNPYQQSVTDAALREAQNASRDQANTAALRSAGTGSAGGSRQAIFQAMAARDEGRLRSDIQAKGSAAGYLNAQEQFERDRASRYNQAQLGSQYGMQGLSAAGQAARGLGELGALQQKTDMERIGAQDRVGGVRQALEQQRMEQRYADFLRQRDYPKEQMGWYSNIIRGLPSEMNSSAITYGQQPSAATQLSGLGITALGAYGGYNDTRSPTS
jgi:hypothetical protein